MRYVRDHSLAAGEVSVLCLACAKWVRLCDALIDRDGPAFRAYYHETCAPKPVPEYIPCPDIESRGCVRPHFTVRGMSNGAA